MRFQLSMCFVAVAFYRRLFDCWVHALHFFVNGARDRVNFFGVSACRWGGIDALEVGQENAALPVLSVDLGFQVEQADHRSSGSLHSSPTCYEPL